MAYRFKNPALRLNVKGIGIVHQANLTDELALRLLASNPAFTKFIEKVEDGKKQNKAKGGKGGKASGKEAAEKGD